MKFNSQICTTRSQSEALLKLGLKKETADMKYVGLCRNEDGSILFQKTPICKGVITENNIDLPAWSLHRLIEMKQPNKKDYMVAVLSREQTYDKLIGMIAKSINGGNFPKEYLEE